MPSYVQVIIQSAILKAAANLTAQVAAGWKSQLSKPAVDWQRVAEFAVFGLIQAHLNWYWQRGLENMLPTRAPLRTDTENDNGGEIIWINVIGKLVLDQTLGLFVMNSTFLACTSAVRVQSLAAVLQIVREKIWNIILAAWKVWPWVSICNFIWVPVESRVLVASLVGFGWNIFLALLSMG